MMMMMMTMMVTTTKLLILLLVMTTCEGDEEDDHHDDDYDQCEPREHAGYCLTCVDYWLSQTSAEHTGVLQKAGQSLASPHPMGKHSSETFLSESSPFWPSRREIPDIFIQYIKP